MKPENKKNLPLTSFVDRIYTEGGKVGYLVLWMLGAPVGLLIVIWLFLGSNIFGAG